MSKTLKFLIFLACSSFVFCLPIQANSPNVEQSPLEQSCNSVDSKYIDICKTAEKITVKIVSQDDPNYKASGILINKEERKHKGKTVYLYLVLTNDHVIQGLKKKGKNYYLTTFDGNTYQTHLYLKKINWDKNDFGLLYFFSNTNYETAKLGVSTKLQNGEDIFVAGFPNDHDNGYSDKFNFTSGQAATLIINKQPLESGYQLGFDNNTRNGMSGGPVLNKEGLLVGINGRGKNQDMGFRSGNEDVPDVDPYAYKDGTKDKPDTIERFKELAWAIPIETYNYNRYKPQPPFKLIPTELEKKITPVKETPSGDNNPQGDVQNNTEEFKENTEKISNRNPIESLLSLYSKNPILLLHYIPFLLVAVLIGQSRFKHKKIINTVTHPNSPIDVESNKPTSTGTLHKDKYPLFEILIDQLTRKITINNNQNQLIIIVTGINNESCHRVYQEKFGYIYFQVINNISDSGKITLDVSNNDNKISSKIITLNNNSDSWTVCSKTPPNQSNQLGKIKFTFTTKRRYF